MNYGTMRTIQKRTVQWMKIIEFDSGKKWPPQSQQLPHNRNRNNSSSLISWTSKCQAGCFFFPSSITKPKSPLLSRERREKSEREEESKNLGRRRRRGENRYGTTARWCGREKAAKRRRSLVEGEGGAGAHFISSLSTDLFLSLSYRKNTTFSHCCL